MLWLVLPVDAFLADERSPTWRPRSPHIDGKVALCDDAARSYYVRHIASASARAYLNWQSS